MCCYSAARRTVNNKEAQEEDRNDKVNLARYEESEWGDDEDIPTASVIGFAKPSPQSTPWIDDTICCNMENMIGYHEYYQDKIDINIRLQERHPHKQIATTMPSFILDDQLYGQRSIMEMMMI